jgi:CheY-like chemotaxis protein
MTIATEGEGARHPRVLVVDDDESMRMTLEAILRRDGHQIVVAAGGEEALARMRGGPPPDLVLLDLLMPGMGGWDVIEAMGQSPGLAEVPVVVLTAFGEGEDLPPGRPVLHKPVDGDVLRGLVHELLAQRARLGSFLEEPPSDLLPRGFYRRARTARTDGAC